MIAWLWYTAAAGLATLHLGVDRRLGTIQSVAADGASGQCTVHEERLTCPADGPVRFRWGGEDAVWTGDQVVAPGEEGVAFVLGYGSSERLAMIRDRSVLPDDIRLLTMSWAGHEPDPLSMEELGALAEQALTNPNVMIRLAALDAMLPYWRRTGMDPLPVNAPDPLAEGLLSELARDASRRFRRRLANRLREVHVAGPLQEEAAMVLRQLMDQGGSVQRVATASMGVSARAGHYPLYDAWFESLQRASTPGPVGRAAVNQLGKLAPLLRRGELPDDIVPDDALRIALLVHKERAWALWFAWRREIPLDEGRALDLLDNTVGVHPGLLLHWSENHAERFWQVVDRWEPASPHTARWHLVTRGLSREKPE